MSARDLVLGYDFGTSSVKAALFDRAGALHASSRASYPLHLPGPGHAEQDPLDWWRAMVTATRELISQVEGAAQRVAALGISAQLCGSVPVDDAGTPLHRCLVSLDTRSARIAHDITAGGPRIGGYGAWRLAGWLRLANGAPNLSGRDPLSKILWLREALRGHRVSRFLDVKDWLVHRCTGRFVTTPDAAQLTWLMDNRIGRRAWSAPYLERFGIGESQLPQIVESTAAVGSLGAAVAAELGLRPEVPVCAGAGDVNAAALAAGRHGEGAYHVCLGTSLWTAAYSSRRRVNVLTGVGTLCAAHADRYLLVAAQENAGAAAAWAAQALGFADLPALDAHAASAAPRAETPLFAPWLQGERVPVDDHRLRGAMAGASLRTTRAELAYAVLAGVALNARWALAEAERCLPAATPELHLLGGGAASSTWARILCDMLQRPLRTVEAPAMGCARGAAMAASVAAGWFDALPATAAMARSGPLIEPARERRAWAEDRYGELRAYWRATRRWHRERRFADA